MSRSDRTADLLEATVQAEFLDGARQYTLRDIKSTATQLHRALGEVKRDAERAMAALTNGHRVSGMTLGTGPLGHQAPADIIKITARLEGLLNQANMLGISAADIESAYKVA